MNVAVILPAAGLGTRMASGFKRAMTGENFFSSVFTNTSTRPLRVAFAAPSPGKIIAVDTRTGQLLENDAVDALLRLGGDEGERPQRRDDPHADRHPPPLCGRDARHEGRQKRFQNIECDREIQPVCIVVHLNDLVYGVRGEVVETHWPVTARGRESDRLALTR